jgi:hypothetical protein
MTMPYVLSALADNQFIVRLAVDRMLDEALNYVMPLMVRRMEDENEPET